MTKRFFLLSGLFLSILGSFYLTSCNDKKQKANLCDSSLVETISLDTIVYVQEGEKSPSCKLTMRLAFLTHTSDTTLSHINRTILANAFGKAYINMSPLQFVQAISDTLIACHHADISEFLTEDLKNGIADKDIPAWYNYEYDLESTLTPGMNDSIWNYVLTDFRQTGGAHPNTIKSYLNIEACTGKVLTKKDVFSPNADKGLSPNIIQSLADYLNGLGREDIHAPATLQGLRNNGLFLETDPYIPENFKLGKDTVCFYYNRYEIACYAAGDFEVKLPLSAVKQYFIKNNN